MVESRSVVVVGGASGIGKAIAVAFAQAGWSVTTADLANADVTVDVTDEAAVEALFAGREGLDAVVTTAGISTWQQVVDHDIAEFRRVLDVDLTGTMIVYKHAGKVVADGGAIVSIGSLNGRQPAVGLAAYCAAKAGLAMLTQVTALELAPRGVRVNAIQPGLVMTPLTDGMNAIPVVKDDFVENTPLGRTGLPEEIAAAALFLCGEGSQWITGTALDVNGGMHMMRYPNLAKLLGL